MRSRLSVRQIKPRVSEMICLRESQTRFTSSICWPRLRVARISDYSLSTLVLQLCTLEQMRKFMEIYVKVPSGIKSSRFWRLEGAVNGTRKASKHWQEFSCDKLVTICFSNRTTSIRVCTHGFVIIWTWNSTATIFLVCGLTSNLEVLTDEFKNNFLVKKAEIVSLKLEHQNEIHFLKRRISVDNFGWLVKLDQRYAKSLLDAKAMNHCKSMATPGSKGQERSRNEADLTEKLDPQEPREFRSESVSI